MEKAPVFKVPYIEDSKAQVKLTRKTDHKTWKFSNNFSDGEFYVKNRGYGEDACIIFRPNNIAAYTSGDQFDVEVTGLEEPITYTVNFFSLSMAGSDTDSNLTPDSNSGTDSNTTPDSNSGTNSNTKPDSGSAQDSDGTSGSIEEPFLDRKLILTKDCRNKFCYPIQCF